MKKILYVLLITALMLSSVSALASCGKGVKSEGACVYLNTWQPEDSSKVHYAKITVEKCGEIILLLDANEAPATVANFLELANSGFYDGLTFHRVIENFMIQGGDPKADGTGGSDKKIPGEFWGNLYPYNDFCHYKGVISMARSDNPNSASSQFFICNADARQLDDSYAAFGFVICGTSVVDYITEKTAKYGDDNGAIENKKNQAVIEKIREISKEEALKYVD